MKNLDEINKLINKKIQEAATYNGKRWKRGYWNQVGVYDVKLNISQIHIIHEALKKVKYLIASILPHNFVKKFIE